MKYLSFLAIFIFLGIGCNAEVQREPVQDAMAPPQGTAVPQVNQMDIDGGIYDHALYFASSSDGETWDLSDEAIVEHASVPDLLVLEQSVGDLSAGTVMSYFVDSSPLIDGKDETVSYVISTDDGQTWSERVEIDLKGDYLPVDPSVIQLDDGRLRLHFFDFTSTRQPSSNGPYVFYSAISDDGINFEIEGESLSSDLIMTDPDVVLLGDTWFMYFAMHDGDAGAVWVATSKDGIVFENPQLIPDFGGIPGAMVVDDHVQLYGCMVGIVMTTSSDGIHFEELPEGKVSDEIGPNGKPLIEGRELFKSDKFFCDPSPAVLSDGSTALVLKTIVED